MARLHQGVTFASVLGWKGLSQHIADGGARLGLGTEGQYAAGCHPALLQPPAWKGFCFAKATKPSKKPCGQVPSVCSWPRYGGGIRSPVALDATSGITVQRALLASPHQVPTACLRAAPRVPQPGGRVQARDQPIGDGARDDLQLHC